VLRVGPDHRRSGGACNSSASAGQSLQFILSTFALVFAAEWGDKSFIATIALAAASSPLGVTLGAVGGHGFATAIAVTVGSVMSNYVSERTVQYVGGSLFLVFAAVTIYDIVAQV
jgi:putative Ca2+/H+ antiporter (TMEM165/GDT1 family)